MANARGAFAAGLGLGAGLMYFLDPARGRRRRSGVRDTVTRSVNRSSDAVGARGRDLAHRMSGVLGWLRFGRRRQPVDDRVLVERARARLGRVVSHPHALRIDATAGVVVLRGPILQAEVRALLKAIARVDGVRQVINELDVHREATGVPALQGGAAPSDAPSQVSKQGKEKNMATLARDVMTPDPACCTPQTTLDKVAKLMVQNDCGEIPVVDSSDQPIGVITDRDIVARVIAEGRNPAAYTAESCMSQPVVTVPDTAPFDEVVSTMEKHQIRRVPVVDGDGCCAGIIAQADVARISREREVAHLVREVSREHAYGLH